jgi:hypothetical protein
MRTQSRSRIAAAGWGALGALVLLSSGASAQKAAPTRQECLTHHEKGQQLRKSASLLEARQSLRACSNEECPALVREDCISLLADVERAVPSVTFEVVADGHDIAGAKIYDNDVLLTDGLKGVPHELNPGVHKIRAEVPGKPPLEATEVIREGEQNRILRLEYAPPPPPPNLLEPAKPTGPRPITAMTWLFAGLTVAAAGAGATFGVLALGKRNQLSCSPLCADSEVQPVKSMALLADASFGGAVLFAGATTIFFLTRPVVPEKDEKDKDKEQGFHPTVLLAPGFGGFGARGSF